MAQPLIGWMECRWNLVRFLRIGLHALLARITALSATAGYGCSAWTRQLQAESRSIRCKEKIYSRRHQGWWRGARGAKPGFNRLHSVIDPQFISFFLPRFDTQDALYDCAWSEVHEQQIVTCSGDGSIKLWDASLRVNIKGHGPLCSLSASHLLEIGLNCPGIPR